jgi:hypothetical protein
MGPPPKEDCLESFSENTRKPKMRQLKAETMIKRKKERESVQQNNQK